MKVDMTSRPRYSIIIPTISDEPLTIKSFPPPEELARLGIELIVSKDRGWRNPSRTRNVGASVSRGEILCFLDDDASLNFEKLLHVLDVVRENKKGFVWYIPPHLLVLHSEDFFKIGGYDERFKPLKGEDIEIRLKLIREGLKELPFEPANLNLHHHERTSHDPRYFHYHYLLNQKHLTWIHIEYKTYPLIKLIVRKNPLELLRRIKWVLEWLLYRRYQKRSIFCVKNKDSSF